MAKQTSRDSPPFLCIGVSIDRKTRSRDLVQTLHNLGISVSYDRVLAISTDLRNEVYRRYIDEGAVCPSNLCLNLFTTAAIDIIDRNPSLTTPRDSFDGTGISLFQQPTTKKPGTTRARLEISHAVQDKKSVSQLPEVYTEVTPVIAPTKHPQISATSVEIQPDGTYFTRGLENSSNVVHNQESLQDEEFVSWGAFHSRDPRHSSLHATSALSALLPLFSDQATSVAMIRHAMDVIMLSENYLNPGQVPVISLHQPLYAVANKIQWNWNDSYGEQKFVVMFGPPYRDGVFESDRRVAGR